jgi:hypothetical protein
VHRFLAEQRLGEEPAAAPDARFDDAPAAQSAA